MSYLSKYRITVSLILSLIVINSNGQEYASDSTINAYLLKAYYAQFDSDWALSISLYDSALQMSQRKGSDLLMASSLWGMALVHSKAGNFFLGNDEDDPRRVKEMELLKEFDYFNQSREYYQRTLELAEKIGNEQLVVYAKYGLLQVAHFLGEYEEALKQIDEFLIFIDQVIDSQEDPSKVPAYIDFRNWTLDQRSSTLLAEGRKKGDSALVLGSLEAFLIAENAYKNSSNQSGLMALHQNWARAHIFLGNSDSALYHSRNGLEWARVTGEATNMLKGFYRMYESFDLLGEADSALSYLKKYTVLSDTVMSTQKSQTMSQFLVLFRTEEIKNENARNELKIKQQNMVIYISGVVLVALVIILIMLNQKRKAQKKIADQRIDELLTRQEIESLQGVLEGQESERKRIAGDLHDKLGAILGMVKLHFSAVEERLDELKVENKLQYDKANELLDQAAEEVRNISHNLMSGHLNKFGLVSALERLADTVESAGKIKVQLIVNRMDERLDNEQELQIYRIIQELVSNILKHAHATEAVIQLNRTEGHLNLIVEDNGGGFDTEVAKTKEGIGLQNLEARVRKINGTIHFDSGKGAGTTVSVDVPLD